MPESITRADLKALLEEVISEKQETEIELTDIVKAVRKYGKIGIIVGALFATFVAAFFFIAVKQVYQSESRLLVTPQNVDLVSYGLQSEVFLDFFIAELPSELSKEISQIRPRDSIADIITFEEGGILSKTSRGSNSKIIEVAVNTDNPQLSAKIADLIGVSFVEWAKSQQDVETQQKIDSISLLMSHHERAVEQAKSELEDYLNKGDHKANEVRMLEFLSSFAKDSSTNAVPQIIMDPEYQLLSDNLQLESRLFSSVKAKKASLDSRILTSDDSIKIVGEAEIQDVAKDWKKYTIFALLAFCVACVGTVVFLSTFAWMRNLV